MNRPSGKRLLAFTSFALLVVLCMCLRYFTINDTLPPFFARLRNVLHLAMLTVWGIYIHKRIIQIQVRRYLLAIAALMALWLIFKMVNYSIDIMDMKRHLWYLYYIAMLFIPTISLFISMSLGKAEDYRLPQKTKLLYIPAAVLLLLVLTNDMHQLVFSFPPGDMTPLNYSHRAGYYIILVWVLLCALAAFFTMVKKCRISHSKRIHILPLVPLALSMVYTAAYIRGFRPVLLLAGDMTAAQCLLISLMFEGCIQCGLIQSNIGYNELFEATTLPIQITDLGFSARKISSAMQEPLSKDELLQMTADTIYMDSDTLLKRHRLRKGWVFWKEDISELNRLSKELELTRDELRDTGNILAAENEQREKHLRLSEENWLYDMMEAQTSRQIEMLRDRLDAIKMATDADKAKRLLGQIIVIGTYIKRRDNLIFVDAQHGEISAQELRLCFNESMESLSLYGTKCKSVIDGEQSLALQQATQIYDLFEAVVETGLDSLQSLLISVEISKQIEVNICVSCQESLESLEKRFPAIEWTLDEDGLQYITCVLKIAGAHNKNQFGLREEAAAHGQN